MPNPDYYPEYDYELSKSVQLPPKLEPTCVFMTGPGGTGKTSVLNWLKDKWGDECTVHGSIVRQYYAKMGVENEEAYSRLLAADKVNFQMGLIDYYVETLEEALPACKTRYFVSDRAVFDHLGYATMMEGLQLSDYTEKFPALMERFLKIIPAAAVFAFFPFPMPWYGNNTVDGFRHVNFSKDLLVSFAHYHYWTAGSVLSSSLRRDKETVFRVMDVRDDIERRGRHLSILVDRTNELHVDARYRKYRHRNMSDKH